MHQSEQHQKLLNLLREDNSNRVPGFSRGQDVSRAAIRRESDRLEAVGKIWLITDDQVPPEAVQKLCELSAEMSLYQGAGE